MTAKEEIHYPNIGDVRSAFISLCRVADRVITKSPINSSQPYSRLHLAISSLSNESLERNYCMV